MSELIAYIAPQNVLPALSDCLLILNSNSTHLDLVVEDEMNPVLQHFILEMPIQRKVFSPSSSRWLLAELSPDIKSSVFFNAKKLVVAAIGFCENHVELAQSIGLPIRCRLGELIAALLQQQLNDDIAISDAILLVNSQLKGELAFICHDQAQVQYMFASCLGRTIYIGLESGLRQLCCSSLRLIRQRANQVYVMKSNDVVRFGLELPILVNEGGRALEMPAVNKNLNIPHFMWEEILSQPESLGNLVQKYKEEYSIPLALRAKLSMIRQVTLLACGSSYHAALIASYWFETLAGVSVNVGLSSDYCERDVHPDPNDLVVAISQSGETADTIAAVQHAQQAGCPRTVAVSNSPGSTLTTLVDHLLLTHSGAEQSVTATKSLTSQILVLFQLALALGDARKVLSAELRDQAQQEMLQLPITVRETILLSKDLRRWAGLLHRKSNIFVIGRHAHYPVACEGAFKLKEVAYLHAVAYSAGELKHGPITLVDENLPVLVCLPWNQFAQKVLDDLQAVRLNQGEIFILSNGNVASAESTHVIRMPNGLELLNPIIYTIAMQLLAYHCAVLSGHDIDAPRNLAKAVV